MPEPIPTAREAVRQLYLDYLDNQYDFEYYKAMRNRIVGVTSHFDFLIALGAAFSGGTGVIGIIKSNVAMAYVCGALAVASVVISAAKQAYGWAAKIEFASDAMNKFHNSARKLEVIVKQVRAQQAFTSDSIKTYKKISEEFRPPVDPYPPLSMKLRKEIQQQIVNSERPQEWWLPRN